MSLANLIGSYIADFLCVIFAKTYRGSFIALVVGVNLGSEFLRRDGVAELVEFVEVVEEGGDGGGSLEVGEVLEAAGERDGRPHFQEGQREAGESGDRQHFSHGELPQQRA